MVTTKDLAYLWIGLALWGVALLAGFALRMDLRYLVMFPILASIIIIPIVIALIAYRKRHYFVGNTLLAILAIPAIMLIVSISGITRRSPSVQRMLASSNLRQCAIALHNYHHDNNHLPPPAITAADGTPLLSWRVLILPYIEQGELYREFRLSEPWDSEHNRKLIPRMPREFANVSDSECPKHHTYVQAFVGPGTAFDPKERVKLSQISSMRGTKLTVLLADGGTPVVWTKPDDISFSVEQGVGPVGGQFPHACTITMSDGATSTMRSPFPLDALREAVQWRSTKQVDLNND